MNIFSYESKLMQTLMVIGDYIILNLMFLVFSIPIFTIGAAQAGLYSGIKVALDKEDDSSCAAAFMRGFKDGFGSITITWCIFLVAILGTAWLVVQTLGFQAAGLEGAPVGFAIVALCVLALFQSLTSAFHASFGCTPWQLIRNAWFMLIGFPIRSILVAALTWGPVIIMLANFYLFMQMTPIFLAGYYSLAVMFNCLLLRKPFKLVMEAYNEANDNDSDPEDAATDEEAEATEAH